MAELSTVARPYAEALFAAATDAGSLDRWVGLTEELGALVRHPQVADLVANPKLDAKQVFDVLGGLLESPLPPEGTNFLQLLSANDRLATLPDIAPPYQAITFDPQAWIADCPVAGSSNWVVGYSVQYALVWIYADGTTSALTAWCPPIQGGPWAMPTLLLPTTTDPNAVGRQVWRQFAGGDPECVGKLDDVSTVRFADTTP